MATREMCYNSAKGKYFKVIFSTCVPSNNTYISGVPGYHGNTGTMATRELYNNLGM